MAMTMRRNSVATVVIVTLLAVATVLMATLGAVNYQTYRERGFTRLRSSLTTQADQLSISLALPVWNIDRPQIDRVLEGLESDRDVQAVVVEAAGKVHARVRDDEWHLGPLEGSLAQPDGLLEEQRAITFSGEKIGSLRLFATPRFVESDLRAARLSILLFILAMDALMVLSVYFVLWRKVLSPLRDIEAYATTVKSGTGGNATQILGRGFTGELESLRSSLEAMVALLDHRYTELRASEERYRLMFEGNPVPMLVYDLDTLGFLAVNQAAVTQYGYSREELLRLTVSDLAVPGDEHLAPFVAARFDPRPEVLHVGHRQQRRKDGGVVQIDLTSINVPFEGRRARLMMSRDITSETKALAERARLEESLRKTQTMSAMGALVAGVAHEVRTPLFSISASLDALESEMGGRQEYAEYAELLRSQVKRLTRLMRDLLDYGKPPTPRIGSARPKDLAKRALRSCAALARKQEVELTEDVPEDLPVLALDASRMEQVFENLLTNAVQHSPRGGVVRLAACLADHTGAVEFRVEDDGPGITDADLPRLFEPFFSRRKGGTGLGLPIIQRIVEAHGGQVTAANRQPAGAVFTVRLPVVQPGGADSGPQ
jgi:PAS domain S-box-containing protein